MDACQHIHERTIELDAVAKEKQLGKVIMQLQQDNIILNSLVYPDTPPEQVEERKGAIKNIVVQFKEMEQDAKMITQAMT